MPSSEAKRGTDPLPGHLVVDAVSSELHDPWDLLEIQRLLRDIAMDFRPRKDVQICVMYIDVSQVQLPLCIPCYEVLAALLHGGQGWLSQMERPLLRYKGVTLSALMKWKSYQAAHQTDDTVCLALQLDSCGACKQDESLVESQLDGLLHCEGLSCPISSAW